MGSMVPVPVPVPVHFPCSVNKPLELVHTATGIGIKFGRWETYLIRLKSVLTGTFWEFLEHEVK